VPRLRISESISLSPTYLHGLERDKPFGNAVIESLYGTSGLVMLLDFHFLNAIFWYALINSEKSRNLNKTLMNESSLNASLKHTTASIEQLYTNEQLRLTCALPPYCKQTNSNATAHYQLILRAHSNWREVKARTNSQFEASSLFTLMIHTNSKLKI
jgi:hypothetical protein